jgi:hypothetical protein
VNAGPKGVQWEFNSSFMSFVFLRTGEDKRAVLQRCFCLMNDLETSANRARKQKAVCRNYAVSRGPGRLRLLRYDRCHFAGVRAFLVQSIHRGNYVVVGAA